MCERGRCVQGGVDQRARQVWDGVQGHVPMDVGVQMQGGVCGPLRGQELLAGRKGPGRHRRQRQPRSFLLAHVALTVGSLLSLQGERPAHSEARGAKAGRAAHSAEQLHSHPQGAGSSDTPAGQGPPVSAMRGQEPRPAGT